MMWFNGRCSGHRLSDYENYHLTMEIVARLMEFKERGELKPQDKEIIVYFARMLQEECGFRPRPLSPLGIKPPAELAPKKNEFFFRSGFTRIAVRALKTLTHSAKPLSVERFKKTMRGIVERLFGVIDNRISKRHLNELIRFCEIFKQEQINWLHLMGH